MTLPGVRLGDTLAAAVFHGSALDVGVQHSSLEVNPWQRLRAQSLLESDEHSAAKTGWRASAHVIGDAQVGESGRRLHALMRHVVDRQHRARVLQGEWQLSEPQT